MPTTSDPPPGFSFAPLQPGAPYFADAVRLFLATWPSEGGPAGITDFFTRYAALPDYHGLVALRALGGTIADVRGVLSARVGAPRR